MARGNFRTGKDICVYCGERATATPNMYKRGPKNQPAYVCERCFDKSASEEEKQNRDAYKVGPKLSKLQQELIDQLEKGVWVSIWDIPDRNVNMNTVWSLKEKGFLDVESRHKEGLGYVVKKL